jgi:AcrR family transcriptional regulator
MGQGVKRSRRAYSSPVREEQMENTRRRAIAAAQKLFVARGYAGTTVAAVADEAGVSPETIYASLGGKRGLLEGVIETAIMGPEGLIVEQQTWLTDVARRPSAHDRLRGWVEASCRTLARTSPIHAVIRGAADREEFGVELRERLLRRRLDGVTAIAATCTGPCGPDSPSSRQPRATPRWSAPRCTTYASPSWAGQPNSTSNGSPSCSTPSCSPKASEAEPTKLVGDHHCHPTVVRQTAEAKGLAGRWP